ncbi:MAG: HI0074 family nucleotidyltransferase substrate-binding subunit [Sulfuricella sp.]
MYFKRALERFRIVVRERDRWVAEGNGDIVLDIGLDARAPRPVFKEAYAQGLFAEEQVWLDMIEMRNLFSHVYDEHEISRILEQLDRYLSAFEALLDRLQRIVPNALASPDG